MNEISVQIQSHHKSVPRLLKSIAESGGSSSNPHLIFKNIELGNFCPRKLFEVVFANEVTNQCGELLNGIVKVHDECRGESNVIFITRKSITNFIKEVVRCPESQPVEHPPQLLDHLQRVCNDLNDCLINKQDISRKQLAIIMKHKLVNEMYTQYAKDARIDHEICQKEELLKKLQKNEYQKQIRFSQMCYSKTDLRTGVSKLKKMDKVSEFKMNDYSTYALPDNLSGSEDLRDHVYFYVFVGFQDPCLLKLLMRYRVPVNCILQISRKKQVDTSEMTYFWKKINEISKNGERFKMLEDSAPMKYVYEEEIPEDIQQRQAFFKQRLQEVEELLMNILDLKRKHIHYIKHLHPRKFKDSDLKSGPFPTYERSLRDVPAEYITIPFIVQSMLLEVEKFLLDAKPKSEKSGNLSFKNLCTSDQDSTQPSYEFCEIEEKKKVDRKKPCPFSLSYFGPPRKVEFSLRKQKFRKFYEGDVLNMNIVADKKARVVSMSDARTLMNQRFFNLMKLFKNFKSKDSMPHIHHQSSPSTQKSILSKEQTDHFLNLLYLSSLKSVEDSKFQENPSENFICSPYEYFENINYLPKSVSSIKNLSNLYNRSDSMLFRWKEPLTNLTLAQWLFQAEQEYAAVNFRYCEATNTLVVYFHQDLNATGTRSRIWKESLRTITCFRDFCTFYYSAESSWFSKFKPLNYVSYQTYAETEEKYVFERLIETNEQYKEYEKYLIPYYYCDNFDLKENSNCPKSENFKKFSHIPPVVKPNFKNIITELQEYPSSEDLTRYCSRSLSYSSLTAYDKKPPRFGLTGASHEFFSLDGIQITVDSGRFHFESFKVSVAVKFDGHTLVGHSRSQHVDPHLVLEDGTVITFNLPRPKRVKEIDSCTCSDELDVVRSLFALNITKFGDDTGNSADYNPLLKDIPKFTPETKHVIPVFNEDLEDIYLDISLLWNRMKKTPYEKNVNRDIKILNSMKKTDVIHKYKDGRKQKYLKRKYKFLEIPYSSYIRRILNQSMHKRYRSVYTRRKFNLKGYNPPVNKEDTTPHIKLSLPNGLILESLTSNQNKEVILIKQTHLHRETFASIMHEDYRLYLDDGKVLIRYSNGNIRILDSQGTILDFKQKHKEEYNPDKCLNNIDTCRKLIYKMSLSPNQFCHNINYSRTRRGHLLLSRELKSNKIPFKDISPLSTLYSSIQMHTLEGVFYKIKEEIVEKKQLAKVLRDYDVFTGQMLLERTDGMLVWMRENGDQVYIFPDGTKITKTVHIEEMPLIINKKDAEGWVIVSHNYLYEHPLYCPIKFENKEKKTTVMLKQRVELNMTKKSIFFTLNGENELTIDSEKIRLVKSCPKCRSECTCEIILNPKDADVESSLLISCKDSYKKVFTSDFSGRCRINENFIKDELNIQNCNHVLRRNFCKAFLINDDMTGDLLWNENMIIREIEKMEELAEGDDPEIVVEQFTDVKSDCMGINFTKSYYEHLSHKFLWTKYLSPILYPMVKSESGSERNMAYQVCRRIFNILREKETKSLYTVIRKLLDEDKTQSEQHQDMLN